MTLTDAALAELVAMPPDDWATHRVSNPSGSRWSFLITEAQFDWLGLARKNVPALVAALRESRAALVVAREALAAREDVSDGEAPRPNRAMSAMTAIDVALGETQ